MIQVAVVGAPLAGKTTLLRGMLARFDGQARSVTKVGVDTKLIADMTMSDHALCVRTLPGVVWSKENWSALVHAADAVLVVVDSRQAAFTLNRQFLEHLRDWPELPDVGCIVYTKTDVAETQSDIKKLIGGTRIESWQQFRTTPHDMSLVRPFAYVLEELRPLE